MQKDYQIYTERVVVQHGIIGIGTDIIEITRIEKAARRRERFLRRVFTSGEINFCMRRRNPWPCLAARFAAKEAVFKALGTGVTNWHEVEICGGGDGPVQVKLTGNALQHARSGQVSTVLLSISHNLGQAVAFATAIHKGE
ncbi:holo-ACP synthase [Desulfallas thermosapovorans]|nr:holo-ACP synthase [Desulfallas thermosapovorans]